MKRILAAMLVTTLFLSALTGCGPTDKKTGSDVSVQGKGDDSGKPTEFNITSIYTSTGTDPNENIILQQMAKEANVSITYDFVVTEWDVKKSTVLASNDLPDAFVGNGVLSTKDVYSNTSLFAPLQDLIKDNAPEIQRVLGEDKELLKNVTGLDGNIFYLTSVGVFEPEVYTSMTINKVWLDKLNLSMPTTLTELEEVLTAFRDKDPNGNNVKDELPMYMALTEDEAWSIRAFMGAFDCPTSITSWFALEGDKVEFQPTTPNFKEYMTWIAGLREKGLMPEELATADWGQRAARLGSETQLVGVTNCWVKDPLHINYQDDYVTLPPLKGPNGAQFIAGNAQLSSNPNFIMSNSCENKEALMRFMNLSFIPEYAVQLHYGDVGTKLEIKDGKYKYLSHPEGMELDTWAYKNSILGNWAYYIPKSFEEKFSELPSNSALKFEINKIYLPFVKPNNNVPTLKFTEEQISELSLIQTDVDGHVKRMIVEWFANGGVEAGWEAYLKELNNMGVDKYIGIYQQAYDTQK